jgi:osmotically-inducible protein OsmY
MNKTFQRTSLALVLAASALGSLTACVPMVLGGAMVGGSMMATDRRTSGTQVEDEGIELTAAARIRENLGERVHVNITSYNRQVLITGEVPNAQDKELVERVVKGVENVSNIVNELGILGNTTLSQRSNDTLVTGRVKAAMVDAQDIFANAFKVTTERGVVYLMGRVTQREAKRATDVIIKTSGVLRLVRVLEIVSEEELARIVPPRQPAEKNKPSN